MNSETQDEQTTERCHKCGDPSYETWEFPFGSGIDLCYECYWAQADEEPPRH